jgi:hypothetical protein
MDDNSVWLGRAFCSVAKENPEFAKGNRGAILNFACSAPSIEQCTQLLANEMTRIELELRGFDFLFQKEYLDREPSEYEAGLVDKLNTYPVQYHNVHFFKGDA